MTARSISRLRVRYAETDQMGVAWHGNFFAWFEVGRTDLLREQGQTYRDLEREGLRLPVIEAHVRFVRPALYDDLLAVSTEVSEIAGARITFRYEVRRDGEEVVLATGMTSHAAVDPTGRPRRFPEDLRRRLTAPAAPEHAVSRQGGTLAAAPAGSGA